MPQQMSRRDFLSCKGMGKLLNKVAPLLGMLDEAATTPLSVSSVIDNEELVADRTVMEGYFSSPIYSYALLSEMPWDMTVDEAIRLGIDYEGRSKMDVIRDIFLGKDQKEGETR